MPVHPFTITYAHHGYLGVVGAVVSGFRGRGPARWSLSRNWLGGRRCGLIGWRWLDRKTIRNSDHEYTGTRLDVILCGCCRYLFNRKVGC